MSGLGRRTFRRLIVEAHDVNALGRLLGAPLVEAVGRLNPFGLFGMRVLRL